MKIFAEAALGNTVDNSKRAGFIKYNRNVLRFHAVWDDRENLYGDMHRFEVSRKQVLREWPWKGCDGCKARLWRSLVFKIYHTQCGRAIASQRGDVCVALARVHFVFVLRCILHVFPTLVLPLAVGIILS